MSDKTVCVSLGDFTRAHGWRVYRVRTVSSTYHVAIGRTNGKGLAILRGYSVGAARLVDVQDSDPRLGTQSLFDVAPSDWAGRPLAFGTTTMRLRFACWRIFRARTARSCGGLPLRP